VHRSREVLVRLPPGASFKVVRPRRRPRRRRKSELPAANANVVDRLPLPWERMPWEADSTSPTWGADPIVAPAPAANAPTSAPAAHEALLVDAKEAARMWGCTLGAFRQRVQRGQIPKWVIRRTGRRVEFIRAKLFDFIEGGAKR
jgi:hypothetical protein